MGIILREEKPDLSDVPRRKTPLPRVGHLFFLMTGILFVVVPLYILSLPRFDKSGFLMCMPILIIIGFLWTLISIWSFANPKSDYHKFRRSNGESKGKITHRYVRKIRTWKRGYRDETKYYHIIFKYEVQLSGGTKKTIILDAQVGAPFYNSHETGSNVKVHYALEDPRLVYLEGELLWFGLPT